ALGAHVHRAGDVMVFLRWGSHDHRQIGRLEVADHALHRLETESGMLEIEQHEIATRRLENVADSGRRELHDEMPELWRLRLSQLLQPLRGHPFLLTCVISGRSAGLGFDPRDCVGVEFQLRLVERTAQRVQRVRRGGGPFERRSVEYARLNSHAPKPLMWIVSGPAVRFASHSTTPSPSRHASAAILRGSDDRVSTRWRPWPRARPAMTWKAG